MSTCLLCLKEFDLGPYQAFGHEVCFNSESRGVALGDLEDEIMAKDGEITKLEDEVEYLEGKVLALKEAADEQHPV